jgi:hypothetical protein
MKTLPPDPIFVRQVKRDFIIGRLPIRIRVQQLRRLLRTHFRHPAAHVPTLLVLDAHQPYELRQSLL